VQLIENILPINYYSELAGIMVDCSILIKLIKIYLPLVYNHLCDIGFEMSLNNVLYKWFVSVFIQNLSTDLSLIIWDMIFLEGNFIFFKAALAILKIMKKTILSKSTLEDINEVFDEDTRQLNDRQTLIYYLIIRKFEFDYDFICKSRLSFQTTIFENIFKDNESKINRISLQESGENNKPKLKRASYVKNVTECSREWPLCIYDNNYKYNVISFLIFRVQNSPQFIENYFGEEDYYEIRSKSKIDKKNKKRFSNNFENFKSHLDCVSDIEDRKNQRRKSSKSSEGFQKIYLDHLEEESDFVIKKRMKPSQGAIKESCNYDIYKNLLIERRTHFCYENEKPEHSEIVCEMQSELLKEEEIEIQDSYIKLKSDQLHRHRSRTSLRPSFIFFEASEKNYCKILTDLNNCNSY
jgi:hypothetical protein